MQYTLRNIPQPIDQALRERARREGTSLNQTVLKILRLALGSEGEPMQYRNLDDIVGTWHEDPEFDEIMADQRRIDPDLWE